MNEIEQAAQRLKGVFAKVVQATAETRPGEARLGRGDGSDTIINPDSVEAGGVWIYYESSDPEGTTIQAVDTAILGEGLDHLYHDGIGLEGTLVKLAQPPGESVLYVVRTDKLSAAQQYGATPLGKQAIQSAAQPALIDISSLKAQWSDNDDLTLVVGDPQEAITYINQVSGALSTFTVGEYDFTDIVTALGTGEHTFSILCIDSADGSLQPITLAATTPPTGYSVPYRAAFGPDDLAAVNVLAYASYIPVALVYSYNGQTAGDPLDILDQDVRLWFGTIGAALIDVRSDEIYKRIFIGI